jgi:DNA-binding transcriptional MerR regulator
MFTQEQISIIKYWLECQKWAIPKHNPAIYNFNIQKRENYAIDDIIKALEKNKGINTVYDSYNPNKKVRRKTVPIHLNPEKMMKQREKEELAELEKQSQALKEELNALKKKIKEEDCAFCGFRAEGDFKCQCGAKLCEDCKDGYCQDCNKDGY